MVPWSEEKCEKFQKIFIHVCLCMYVFVSLLEVASSRKMQPTHCLPWAIEQLQRRGLVRCIQDSSSLHGTTEPCESDARP